MPKEEFGVHLAHILFSGPLLMYVGHQKPDAAWIYKLLLVLGVILVALFGYKSIKHQPLSQMHVFYVLHACAFGGLLIYVGIHGRKSPDVVFSLILVVGVGAFGYHAIRLFDAMK